MLAQRMTPAGMFCTVQCRGRERVRRRQNRVVMGTGAGVWSWVEGKIGSIGLWHIPSPFLGLIT